jgi:hypothetical protein
MLLDTVIYAYIYRGFSVIGIVVIILSFVYLLWKPTSTKTQAPQKRKPITFRVSNIPISITKEDFKLILECATDSLSHGKGASRCELLGWSYARSGHSPQFCVATTTFRGSPDPGKLEAAIRHDVTKNLALLRVDSNFFGMTTIYNHDNPAIE